MSKNFLNRCIFTPTAGGVSDFIVDSAKTGYLTPTEAGVIDGGTYSYFAESSNKSQWEVGTGVYDTATQSIGRTTILFSSDSGSKVDFSQSPVVHLGCMFAEDADVVEFQTLADATAATIPTSITTVFLRGRSTVGVGAARYISVNSDPGHNLSFQTANLRWFEISEPLIRLEMGGDVDFTGVTACDTALANVLDYALPRGKPVRLPVGLLLFNSQYTFNYTTQGSFDISGDSEQGTEIRIPAGSDGFIKITTNGGTPSITKGSFGNLRLRPMGAGCGIGFEFNPAGGGTTQNRNIRLYNMFIGPESTDNGFYFTKGYSLSGCDRPIVENVRVLGDPQDSYTLTITSITAANPGVLNIPAHGMIEDDRVTYNANGSTVPGGVTDGNTYYIHVVDVDNVNLKSAAGGSSIQFTSAGTGAGIATLTVLDFRDTSPLYHMTTGAELDNCYSPIVLNCSVCAAAIGFSFDGTNQEGAWVFRNSAVSCKTGFYVNRTITQPTFWFAHNNVQFRDRGLDATGIFGSYIEENDFRQATYAQHSPSAPIDIRLDDVVNIKLNGNSHGYPGDLRRIAYLVGDTKRGREVVINTPYFSDNFATLVKAGNATLSDNIVVKTPIIGAGTVFTDRVVTASTTGLEISWDSMDENNTVARTRNFVSWAKTGNTGAVDALERAATGLVAGDVIGIRRWQALNTVGSTKTFAEMQGIIGNLVNNNNTEGILKLFVAGGSAHSGGLVERLALDKNGLGFNGSTPLAKPTITGSKGSNAALASLLTQLASYGLITDSTT